MDQIQEVYLNFDEPVPSERDTYRTINYPFKVKRENVKPFTETLIDNLGLGTFTSFTVFKIKS